MSNVQRLFHSLSQARRWIVLQFVLTPAIILAGVGWTRLPDKHLWQVALDLLIPLLLVVCALELEAATVRAFAANDGRRVKLVWGAVTLLVWIAVGAAFWALLDWCDDQIPLWAGYLNSRASAHARSVVFTYAHIVRWLTIAEWILRWIVLPGKLIVLGAASAQWGWRLPVRKIYRILLSGRWWLGVILAALVGVLLISRFFVGLPHGTVSAQVWTVVLKLAATYLLAVGTWVLLLAWVATLFARQNPPAEEALVAVPVLTGSPQGKQGAAAEIPPPDDTPA
ncbi:MAG: hypothetical protein ABSF28_01310 [Terracidiphilus sp.]|jgi:hypothetical protein